MSESKGLRYVLEGFKSLFVAQPPAPPPPPAEAPGQKRKVTRMTCSYRIDCDLDGRRFKAVVVDLSMTGMRIELPKAVKPGAEMTVRYDSTGPEKLGTESLQARVLWCRPRKNSAAVEAGLTYLETEAVIAQSWVRKTLHHLGLELHGMEERRKHIRVKAEVVAEALPVDGGAKGIGGMIVNLGAAGCLFECHTTLRLQTRVRISMGPHGELPVLSIEGRVVRVHQVEGEKVWQMGIQFGSMRIRDEKLLGRYLASLLMAELAASQSRP